MKARFLVIKTHRDGSSFVANPNVLMSYEDAKRVKQIWETQQDKYVEFHIYELHD